MFRFRFTIFTPNTIENEDELYLTIGDSSEPLSMKKTAKTEKWMIHKYGQHMRPFECIVSVPNTLSGTDGQFDKQSGDVLISYKF